MWNMRPNPRYIPAKFGEDSLKPEKVMAKKHQNVYQKKNKNKNTDETLQEQKDIPITWGCPNNKNTDETLQEQKDIPITWGCPNKNTHYEASLCPILMNKASLERA